jgi:hypothetical protein
MQEAMKKLKTSRKTFQKRAIGVLTRLMSEDSKNPVEKSVPSSHLIPLIPFGNPVVHLDLVPVDSFQQLAKVSYSLKVIDLIYEENFDLKNEKIALLNKLSCQKEDVEKLATQVTDLSLRNTELSITVQQLKKENAELKEANNYLKIRLALIEADLEKVNNKFLRLSLREAMRSLENYCVLEAIGQKRMVTEGIYTWGKLKPLLSADQELKQKVDQVLVENSLTVEHMSALAYFKQKGDRIVHDEYVISITAWFYVLTCRSKAVSKESLYDPIETDADLQKKKEQLLATLEFFCQKHSKSFGISPL